MRKSQLAETLARRLGIRLGRINSLTQCASEADLLPTSCGPPYPELTPIEIARMLLIAVADEGLGCVPRTINKYGGLKCAEINSSLEATLGHTLTRPERLPASHSGLIIHTSDAPSALLTVATPDGVREYTFASNETVQTEGVERTVRVSGVALFAIAAEIAGRSSADVDALLEGADALQRSPAAVAA
jgi:hypothetical protein